MTYSVSSLFISFMCYRILVIYSIMSPYGTKTTCTRDHCSTCMGAWGLLPYLIKHLLVRFFEESKLRDWKFELWFRFWIWQMPQEQCFHDTWQIYIKRFHSTVETLYSTIYFCKYLIELNFDKSTQYVALWTHKRHPIPRPFGRAMECLLWVFQQKLTVL